ATADVNGDGFNDVIISNGHGPGSQPFVSIFDGKSLFSNPSKTVLIAQFLAYPAQFSGGVNIAAGHVRGPGDNRAQIITSPASGDVNGDGFADIAAAPAAAGGPNVRVFSGQNGALIDNFFAYDPNFTGGVALELGDFNLDGFADILTGQGPGGSELIRVFSGL